MTPCSDISSCLWCCESHAMSDNEQDELMRAALRLALSTLNLCHEYQNRLPGDVVMRIRQAIKAASHPRFTSCITGVSV